jgi:hypothetical protein
MAQDVMILMEENPFRGHWQGWALKIETFLGPEMATSEGPTPSNGPSNRFAPIKIIKSAPYKKTGTMVILCT